MPLLSSSASVALPGYLVTGVKLDAQQRVMQVRWFMADRDAAGLLSRVTPESVVDTVEVVNKLLDAEAVATLFSLADRLEIGPVIKVHVQADGTELIEVDEPARHPGRTLLDLPRLSS